MTNVYAIDMNGKKEFYGMAKNDRELFKFTDDIEEMGMSWDFDLIQLTY